MKSVIKGFLFKLFRWEFWPSKIIYFIPGLYLFYLAIKSKSFGFFSAANPSIVYGGIINTSKYDIYQLIPPLYYPKTLLFSSNTNIGLILKKLVLSNITFPLIGKPNLGFQGIGVEILNTKADLEKYLYYSKCEFIIQPFIDFPYEIGVFYCRLPNSLNGEITGIVSKEFPSIVGDGISSVKELINEDERLLSQFSLFDSTVHESIHVILSKDEIFYLTKIGNHARGTKFLDASIIQTEKLSHTIDNICKQIPLFYYGRIDLKFNTLEELENGINIYIIELNGVMSLPTHMYDPKHSIFFAWSEMIRHFKYLYIISLQNRTNGFNCISFIEVLKMIKIYFRNSKIVRSK